MINSRCSEEETIAGVAAWMHQLGVPQGTYQMQKVLDFGTLGHVDED
jgi:hypothetical protein